MRVSAAMTSGMRVPAEPLHSNEKPVAAIFRSPVFNASETFVRMQAMQLAAYQPVIVGLEDKGHVPSALEGRILLAESRAQAFAIRAAGHWGSLGDRVAGFRPSLIHAHFGTDGLIALPLANRLGIPLVTTLHGYDVSRTRRNLLASGRLSWARYALWGRTLMEQGSLFLAVSEALRTEAIARGFPAERTVTHYVGVDLDRFRPAVAPADKPTILHVGRLVEKKGTEVLLKSFAGVRAQLPDARLVICGDGPLRSSLERLAGELGVAGAVEFRGQVAPLDLAPLLQASALLVAPSVTARSGDAEGLPTVIVEAAASGLPVIASDHGGISEAVVDGRTGFLVPEHDAALLERRIVEVLSSPKLRGKLGSASRRLAEERFDAARQTGLLEQHYDTARRSFAQTTRSKATATR